MTVHAENQVAQSLLLKFLQTYSEIRRLSLTYEIPRLFRSVGTLYKALKQNKNVQNKKNYTGVAVIHVTISLSVLQ